ncbi:MAG: glycoside hydrolase family 15, partial [Actinomycetales bacterium]|nr:glycoside hydrolase family 15 [Actinomycetales bacterium]
NAFHTWAAGVLTDRTEQVANLVAARRRGETPSDGELLPTRFTLDGHEGTDPWWNFQTDGYGTWLWALATHVARHDLDPAPWRAGAAVATDYLLAFWDLPCFDWWEEHDEQRHVSTLGAIYGGLRAAAHGGLLDPERAQSALAAAEAIASLVRAEGTTTGRAPAEAPAPAGAPATSSPSDTSAAPREHLAKWLGSPAVDASLASCVVPFGLAAPGSDLATATLDAISADLDVEGGVYRFRADVFYGGGRWPLLACLLGWNRAAAGDTDAALAHLRWAAAQADEHGELPEQVPGHLLAPEHRQEWLDRWGPVASPLLWSHGMFLVLADELGLLPEER